MEILHRGRYHGRAYNFKPQHHCISVNVLQCSCAEANSSWPYEVGASVHIGVEQ
jgi:hypothetical protein